MSCRSGCASFEVASPAPPPACSGSPGRGFLPPVMAPPPLSCRGCGQRGRSLEPQSGAAAGEPPHQVSPSGSWAWHFGSGSTPRLPPVPPPPPQLPTQWIVWWLVSNGRAHRSYPLQADGQLGMQYGSGLYSAHVPSKPNLQSRSALGFVASGGGHRCFFAHRAPVTTKK